VPNYDNYVLEALCSLHRRFSFRSFFLPNFFFHLPQMLLMT